MKWKRKIELKYIINSRPALMPEDDVPIDIVENLCEILDKDAELAIFANDLRDCQVVEEFNNILDDIYDYCDENKIWIS